MPAIILSFVHLSIPITSHVFCPRDECNHFGGDLARITTSEVQSFIEENVLLSSSNTGDISPRQRSGTQGAWIGCSNLENKGTYMLARLQDLRPEEAAATPEPCYTGNNWGAGQPDNLGGNEHCVNVVSSSESNAKAAWHDSPCDDLNEFICMVPLPQTEMARRTHPNNVQCAATPLSDGGAPSTTNPGGVFAGDRDSSAGGGGGGSNSSDSNGANADQNQPAISNGAVAGGVVGGVVFGLAACILILVARRRGQENGVGTWGGLKIMRGGKEQRLLKEIVATVNQRAQLTFLSTYSNKLFSNVASAEEYTALIDSLEVPRGQLKFNGTVLGSGNYGEVKYATMAANSAVINANDATPSSSSSSSSLVQELAVKSRLPLETDVTVDEALLVEALVLHGLKHNSILALVGVHTTSTPFLILTEFMPNGDLKSFLRACRPSQPKPKAAITLLDVALMTERIASALAHLESVQVVHRDVAARNILVGLLPHTVKLGDLGAARSVFRLADREYSATNDHNPARWMVRAAIYIYSGVYIYLKYGTRLFVRA